MRAFVAVPAPAHPPLVALLDELASLPADVKPVEPQNLHFTLSFLGEVPDEERASLADAIDQAGRGQPAFRAAFQGVGAFPSARRPRVVWVGVEDPRPFAQLALRARAALAAAGHAGDEKDFRAHLTLARVRSERGVDALVSWLKRHGQDALGALDVRELVVYRSRLGPGGPTYDALHRAPLEG